MEARSRSLAAVTLAASLLAAIPSVAKRPGSPSRRRWFRRRRPGIQLYVRDEQALKAASGLRAGAEALLFVQTTPTRRRPPSTCRSAASHDGLHRRSAKHDGTWMDLRGYGRSTRPKEMDQPPEANEPDRHDRCGGARRGAAVVDPHPPEGAGIDKLDLLGWSWGTSTGCMAGYTQANPERVNRLVLYATLWKPKEARPPPRSSAPTAFQLPTSFVRGASWVAAHTPPNGDGLVSVGTSVGKARGGADGPRRECLDRPRDRGMPVRRRAAGPTAARAARPDGGRDRRDTPLACQDGAGTKAAYRFFANERVSEGEILGGHFRATRVLASGNSGRSWCSTTRPITYRRRRIERVGKTCRVNSGKDPTSRFRACTPSAGC